MSIIRLFVKYIINCVHIIRLRCCKKSCKTHYFTMFNHTCEKLHINFVKHIAGVHKKATHTAVIGELGRFPLFFNVIVSMVKYLQRLINCDSKSLLSNAFSRK